jgi:hypothetical protein
LLTHGCHCWRELRRQRVGEFSSHCVYVDKIIKGIAPGDLPNRVSRHARARHYLKTAKALGIEVSSGCFIDNKARIIVDVEHTQANRIAEIAITDTMIERFRERFDLQPRQLAGDTVYGAVRLLKWWVDREIGPHIPVWDKSARSDGTFSRADFGFDRSHDKCRAESRLSSWSNNSGRISSTAGMGQRQFALHKSEVAHGLRGLEVDDELVACRPLDKADHSSLSAHLVRDQRFRRGATVPRAG